MPSQKEQATNDSTAKDSDNLDVYSHLGFRPWDKDDAFPLAQVDITDNELYFIMQ